MLFLFTDKRGEKKKERCTSNRKTSLKKIVNLKRVAKQPVDNKCFPEKSKCTIEDQENHVSSGSSDKSANTDKSSSYNEESSPNNTLVEASPPKPDISKLFHVYFHILVIELLKYSIV